LGKIITALIFALLVAIAIVAYPKFSGVQPANTPTVANSPAEPQTTSGRASVVDGDTIEIHGIRIRLFGIDAPESGQTCAVQGKAYPVGQRAAFALANKIANQVVECRPKDQDRYGRIVAVCRVGADDINGWMVAQGWATGYRHYSTDYINQEERAKKEKRGIWQCDEFEAPSEWRRNHPQQNNSQRPKTASPRPQPKSVVYYPGGDKPGTPYQTLEQCQQARQQAGNVGVCLMR
jgi:endonuclease YncB( thermonuclease family)